MKKLFRNQYSSFLLSFLGVLAAYWLYAGIVVPIVLPRDPHFAQHIAMVNSGGTTEAMEWKQHLNNLFPEGDWERSSKFSIWKDNFVLLFNDYKELGNQVEMNPCTILFLTGELGKDDEKLFQEAIRLQSTGGATLEFDGPFSPLAGNQAKFTQGRLTGDVLIRSNMQNPGPEDDLTISTKEVAFTDSRIHADSDIDFRFGKSHGKGRALYIFLAPSDPRNSKGAKTISRMEILEIQKIHLNTPSDRKKPTGEIQEDRFEITCNDKVEFYPDPGSNFHWIGKFNADVNVARVDEGYYDHLECNQLSVLFAPKPKPGEEPIPNNELASLQQLAPLKMLAVGNAKVRSTNNNDFLAEGHKLEYDFEKGRLALDSDPTLNQTVKISLYGGKQWAGGKKISYTFGENGQFGELFVLSGGTLSGIVSSDKPQEQPQTFQIEWTDDLQAFPEPGNPELVRCQLFGQMSMRIDNLGTMHAKETVIWFKQNPGETAQPPESPPTAGRNPLIRQVSGTQPQTPVLPTPGSSAHSPQRTANTPTALTGGLQSLTLSHARIRKDVRFITANGTCRVNEINVWFEEGGTATPGPQYASSHTSDTMLMNSNATTASPRAGNSSRSFFGGHSGDSQFELFGDTLELLVKMQGTNMEIDRLVLNGGGKQVRLVETTPKQPADPITMSGTEIHAWSPSSDRSVVQLLGTPAIPGHITGMESTVTGLDIIFNQQSNQIKINGGGKIESTQMAMSGDLTAPATSAASQKQMLVVRWAGGMTFDGTRTTFERSVVAKYPQMELFCDVLHLDLDQPISLIQLNASQNTRVRRIECLGKVFFEREERDPIDLTRKKSLLKGENLDQIQLFPESGRFDGTAQGTGQGRLQATFLDEGGGAANFLAGTPRNDVPRAEAPHNDASHLTRIDLYFYGRILGNFKNFEATATDSVVCVYCPVSAWDANINMDDRETLKEKDGYRLDCDILEVVKMVDPQTQRPGIELTASGATKIEGQMVFARAESVKFNQLKETVIIEGSGSNTAEVYIRRDSSGEYEGPISVQQVIYNLRTKNFESKGARGTQFFR